jgi:hypothetical protein
MRKVITGALIALAVAVIVLAVTGLVWYVPATDTVKGHYCFGTIAQCFKS